MSRPEPSLPDLAERAITSLLDHDPVEATYLGDHRRDGLLPDPSAGADAQRAAELRALVAELDTLQPDPGDDAADDRADAAVLRTVLAGELLDLDTIREAEWNPMLHNPGGGIHALLSRDFAPLPDRIDSITARLTAVPAYLAAARERLASGGDVSAPHLHTAIEQLGGTLGLLTDAVQLATGKSLSGAPRLQAAEEHARVALLEHRDHLTGLRAAAGRDPRLGAEVFRAKLSLTLDTAFAPEQLLHAAENDLDRLESEIIAEAGRYSGVAAPDAATVRTVLDELSEQAPTDETVLEHCRAALAETTAFVRSRELVTVHDDPVHVVAMPEIDRGVAVAYCRPSGPLEADPLPTEFCVSPTPAGWDAERISSFYREYNAHMLHNLTVHEAMPGHALQLMHANRHRGRTRVRDVWWSGSFVEGWAVYAEEVMAAHGYRSDVSDRAAASVRMQQLKMKLRTTINAILDIRFHCDDLDETGALELMRRRGFQEQGEAVGKWRRVQLTSTQLCTYYVGYREVRTLADDLRAAQPGWSQRRLHDTMLAHGSPPARHLRGLLGLGEPGG